MRVSLITLGCKTNQFESQAMEKLFVAAGDQVVSFKEHCDVCVINTCTVTATGDSKSRSAVRRARALHPNAVIAVCGCLAELRGDELADNCGADLVGGNRDHISFVKNVRKAFFFKGTHTFDNQIGN